MISRKGIDRLLRRGPELRGSSHFLVDSPDWFRAHLFRWNTPLRGMWWQNRALGGAGKIEGSDSRVINGTFFAIQLAGKVFGYPELR